MDQKLKNKREKYIGFKEEIGLEIVGGVGRERRLRRRGRDSLVRRLISRI